MFYVQTRQNEQRLNTQKRKIRSFEEGHVRRQALRWSMGLLRLR